MKNKQLMNAINELDERLISDALSYRKPRRSFGALAAAAAVIVGVGIVAIPAARWMRTAAPDITPATSATSAEETVGFEPAVFDGLLAFVHEPQIDNPAIELIPDGGAYLLKNLTDTVQPVVIRYPYLTTFNDAVAMPYVMRDRYSEEDIDAMIFSHALGREQMELTDDGWNIANLDGEPDLSAPTHYPMDTPIGVYVLTGTNPTGLDESFTVKFTADEDIDVFTFGFNGWTKHENTYTLSRNDDGDMTAYIALIGGDVRNWEDSQIGVSRDEKPFHDYRVTLYEMTLDEFVKTVIKADNARLDDPTDSTVYLYEAEPYLYRQAVIDWMYSYTALSEENAPRYETGRMETIIADVRLVPRIMVMQCSTTVPAGATDRFTIENGGLAG